MLLYIRNKQTRPEYGKELVEMNAWVLTVLYIGDKLARAEEITDAKINAVALNPFGETSSQCRKLMKLTDRKRRLVNMQVLSHRLRCCLDEEEKERSQLRGYIGSARPVEGYRLQTHKKGGRQVRGRFGKTGILQGEARKRLRRCARGQIGVRYVRNARPSRVLGGLTFKR